MGKIKKVIVRSFLAIVAIVIGVLVYSFSSIVFLLAIVILMIWNRHLIHSCFQRRGNIFMVEPKESAVLICEVFPKDVLDWIGLQRKRGIKLKMRVPEGRLQMKDVIVIADTGQAFVDIKKKYNIPTVIYHISIKKKNYFLKNSSTIN